MLESCAAMKRDFLPPAAPSTSCVIASVCDAEGWRAVCAGAASCRCHAVELRLDLLPEDFFASVLQLEAQNCPMPLLLTLRHASEGGGRSMPEELRRMRALALLPYASALDWEIAQMEGAAELLAAAREAGVTLVASSHDFEQLPPVEELLAQEERARSLGADVVKFAFRLNCEADLLAGVELLRRATGPMAVMGMGPLGPVSRLLYAQYGSCLTYGYMGKAPTAPGQWPASLFMEALAQLQPAF